MTVLSSWYVKNANSKNMTSQQSHCRTWNILDAEIVFLVRVEFLQEMVFNVAKYEDCSGKHATELALAEVCNIQLMV